jgi:hypothetical protein
MEVEPRDDDEEAGNWRTHTLRYGYSVFGDERGSDEWLAYHFHPSTGVAHPHLHLNADALWAPKGLRKRHLPTGRVSLEDVVHVLVEDFGVSPRRKGWFKEIDRNRQMFDARRNW